MDSKTGNYVIVAITCEKRREKKMLTKKKIREWFRGEREGKGRKELYGEEKGIKRRSQEEEGEGGDLYKGQGITYEIPPANISPYLHQGHPIIIGGGGIIQNGIADFSSTFFHIDI